MPARLLLAGLAITAGLSTTAGCMTRRSAQIASLQAEQEALAARTDQLEHDANARAATMQADFEARETALREELTALREELDAQQARAAAEPEPVAEAESHETASNGKQRSSTEGASGRSRTSKPATEEPEPEPPATEPANPADRVHALMADVASRLQVASETSQEDQQTKTQLGKARQMLVEADRAAAQKDYVRAEELAHSAAEVITAVASTGEFSPTR